MLGIKYFAILSGNKLLLFNNKEAAIAYAKGDLEEWNNKPV